MATGNGVSMQQQQQQKFLGVTPPIALNGPTARDNEVTETLLEELKKQGVYETEGEAKVR